MLKENKLATVSTVVCLVLIIGLLVLQFLPFWSFVGESGEQSISIAGYVWFPNGDVQNEFEEVVKDEVYPGEGLNDNKVVNRIVLFPAFIFAFCVVAIAACVLKFKNGFLPSLATVVAGVVATVGYIMSPVLAMSDSQMIHLVVSICILVIAIVIMVLNIKSKISAKKA